MDVEGRKGEGGALLLRKKGVGEGEVG